MPGPTNPTDAAALPDVDSRNAPTPQDVASSDWPSPPPATAGPGIGAAWSDHQTTGVSDGSVVPGGPDADHPHLFHLADWAGNVFDGGSLQGANGENWPILVDQKAAVYLARLTVGGIREPHWHPSAWEVNVVLAGRVRWSFVGPNSTQDVFEGGKGDVIFAPQGHFHYFENASTTEDLVVLIVFNADAAEPKDDVALAQSISSVPASVMAAIFGVDTSVFANLPPVRNRLTIVAHPGGGTGAA